MAEKFEDKLKEIAAKRKKMIKGPDGKMMNHPNVLGAGAKKRKNLHGQDKARVVMKEFQHGTLHSGSGDIVKNREQAIAIAMSEAGLSRKRKG